VFPLIRTKFEGIPIWRPFNYSIILQEEFGHRALDNGLHHVRNLAYSKEFKFNFETEEWNIMRSCEQLYENYITPNLNKKKTNFPNFNWINELYSSPNQPFKCVVSEISEAGDVVSIIGQWDTFSPLSATANHISINSRYKRNRYKQNYFFVYIFPFATLPI
jgi:hypothetical protein